MSASTTSAFVVPEFIREPSKSGKGGVPGTVPYCFLGGAKSDMANFAVDGKKRLHRV